MFAAPYSKKEKQKTVRTPVRRHMTILRGSNASNSKKMRTKKTGKNVHRHRRPTRRAETAKARREKKRRRRRTRSSRKKRGGMKRRSYTR